MPVTGLPLTTTSPDVAACRPETRASVVDFPQPVGPTTVTNSPCRTLRSTSRIAVYDPSRVGKALVAAFSEMAYLGAAGEVVMAGDRRCEFRHGARMCRLFFQFAHSAVSGFLS